MKKILSACVTVLVAATLSACSNTQSTNSTKNSSSEKASSTKVAKNNSAKTSSDDSEDSSPSSQKERSLDELKPQQVAAGVLYLGTKSNTSWHNILDADDAKIEVDVMLNNSHSQEYYSEPGNGATYQFIVNDMTGGQINDYVLSKDKRTIYCYSQQEQNSIHRHVSPFATIPVDDLVNLFDGSNADEVNDLASQITKIKEVESN